MRTVFLDIETGGLKISDPILQIAAIAVDEVWTEVASFERKITVDPAKCDPVALSINHFDEAIWAAEAKTETYVAAELKAFLDRFRDVQLVSRKGRPYSVARIGGHNIAFDLNRLLELFKRYGMFLPVQLNSVLDTQHGAAWFFETHKPLPENYRLATLAERIGVPTTGAHDALTDVRLSIALAKHFLGGF